MFINKARFKEWLLDHEPGDEVGWSCTLHDCPLARFTHGYIASSMPIPKWASNFVEVVDDDCQRTNQITAFAALLMLEGC